MDDLVDMIVSDDSPSKISDAIKNILFAKSTERINTATPYVASSLFDEEDTEDYEDDNEDDFNDDDYEDDGEN
jgi:hypothetical protein